MHKADLKQVFNNTVALLFGIAIMQASSELICSHVANNKHLGVLRCAFYHLQARKPFCKSHQRKLYFCKWKSCVTV